MMLVARRTRLWLADKVSGNVESKNVRIYAPSRTPKIREKRRAAKSRNAELRTYANQR